MAQAVAQAEEHTSLLSLPDEILLHAARLCLSASLPAAVRLATQTCHTLRRALQPLPAEAERRRLRWQPSLTLRHAISSDGRLLTKTHANGQDCACAAGPLLPTAGRSAWRLRVEEADGEAAILVGVCDAAGRSEWGLNLRRGDLVHLNRNHKGQIVSVGKSAVLMTFQQRVAHLANLDRVKVVEVIVDHDASTLTFSIDGAPPLLPAPISPCAADATVLERDGEGCFLRRGHTPSS